MPVASKGTQTAHPTSRNGLQLISDSYLEPMKRLCEEQGIEFDREIPVGMMIEVPSAALMASADSTR